MKKKHLLVMIASILAMVLAAGQAVAVEFDINGNPMTVVGFYSQTLQYGLQDEYDTEPGPNAALANIYLEADYSPSDNVALYGALMLSADLIYPVKEATDDTSWKARNFDDSRSSLFLDDEWWQILKEAHLTYTPGDWTIRVGKQRVSWGEMEVFGVNDLINPIDQTRGLSDIELETLFIPIPLVRAQYDSSAELGPLSGLGVQLVYNPNIDHIANTGTAFGNDAAGIWAADVIEDIGFPVRIGRQDVVMDETESLDPDDMEIGGRAFATLGDNTLLSVMGFYGRNNKPVTTVFADLAADSFTRVDNSGVDIINLKDQGHFARQKYVGAAMATELPIRISAIGGFAPIFRLEGSYQFDNEYYDLNQGLAVPGEPDRGFVKSDQAVVGTNLETKIRLPWQRGFLTLFAEAQYNKLMDYDNSWDLWEGPEDYWNFFAFASTTYMGGRLLTELDYYALEDTNVAIWTPIVGYTFNERWSAKVKANFFVGPEIDAWGLGNKDNVVLKINYNFN